jgi:FkbM family methyltransferase
VKAAHLLPRLVVHPTLVPLALRRVHLGEFTTLNVRWVREAGINTVIDVGANTGQFASAAHAVLPNARIYSFEPLTECYEELVRRFGRMEKYHAFNVALGSHEGETTFYRNEFTKSSSVLEMTDLHRQAYPWTTSTTPLTVELRTLDSFLQNLDLASRVLLKIDVQGFEDRVLRGSERVIQMIDYVLVETSFEPLYREQASFATVYEILTGFGLRYAGDMDQLRNPEDDRVLQSDALFVRQETAT